MNLGWYTLTCCGTVITVACCTICWYRKCADMVFVVRHCSYTAIVVSQFNKCIDWISLYFVENIIIVNLLYNYTSHAIFCEWHVELLLVYVQQGHLAESISLTLHGIYLKDVEILGNLTAVTELTESSEKMWEKKTCQGKLLALRVTAVQQTVVGRIVYCLSLRFCCSLNQHEHFSRMCSDNCSVLVALMMIYMREMSAKFTVPGKWSSEYGMKECITVRWWCCVV